MKKSIGFIAKCILAALPLIAICAYTLLMPFAYMDSEYPAWKYTADVVRLRGTDEDYSTVILGDSRAMAALIPQQFSESTVNLALGGGTYIEMYYFFKDYLKGHDKPDNVIIMFAPFHYSLIDNYTTRTMYFRSLTIGEALEVFRLAGLANADSIYFKNVAADDLACRLGLPNKYLPALYNSRIFGRLADNRSAYEGLTLSHGHGYFGTADGCSDLNYETNYTEMRHDGNAELIHEYAVRLLDLLADEDIPVTVLQAPMNRSSYERLDSGYIAEYTGYTDDLFSGYGNIIYETDIPCYEDEYFGDSSHLNSLGACKYTQETIEKYFDK